MYFSFYTKYCSFLLCEQSLAQPWCSCICYLPTRLKGMQLGSPFPGNSAPSIRGRSQNRVRTNNKQSWNWTGPCAQENQPHMNSHHGERRKGKKSFKNKLRREKDRPRDWLHTDWPPHECVRDKAWERTASLDLPRKGAPISWLIWKVMTETKISNSTRKEMALVYV